VATASETQPALPVDLEGSGATVRLANGTAVHLLLAESISSKNAQQGGTVKLQVLGDVKVGDLVVIGNKAPATAIIETAQGAGRAWRRGSLLLKLGTVMLLNEQQQPLRAWNAVRGKDTGAAADWTNAALQIYGFALLFLPFAPLQHGNEAVMPRGTVLEAVINGDVLLSRAAIEAAQPKPAEPRHGLSGGRHPTNSPVGSQLAATVIGLKQPKTDPGVGTTKPLSALAPLHQCEVHSVAFLPANLRPMIA
jgi:hypothetical protein